MPAFKVFKIRGKKYEPTIEEGEKWQLGIYSSLILQTRSEERCRK